MLKYVWLFLVALLVPAYSQANETESTSISDTLSIPRDITVTNGVRTVRR